MDEKALFTQILAKHIRMKRRELDISHESLSSMTGIDDKHLGKIERQKKTPNSYTLGRIMIALDLNFTQIMIEFLWEEHERNH